MAAQGDTLYSFGGDDGTAIIDTAYKYTPATNTWTALAPLPVPRVGHQAVSDGTAIYILGGVGLESIARAPTHCGATTPH